MTSSHIGKDDVVNIKLTFLMKYASLYNSNKYCTTKQSIILGILSNFSDLINLNESKILVNNQYLIYFIITYEFNLH